MKKRLIDRWAGLFSATWLLLGQAVAAETNTLVIPPEFADQPGNRLGNGLLTLDKEYQAVYSGSLFSGGGTDILLITGIAFRFDESYPPSASFDLILPFVEIHASTHVGPISRLSRFENENWGADRMVVLSRRNLRVSGTSSPNLSEFPIKLTFDVPFSYDRRAGNLLFDFKSDVFGGGGPFIDAASAAGNDRMGFLSPGGNPILGTGDILEISYISVPEPTVLFIWMTCLIFTLLIKTRHL